MSRELLPPGFRFHPTDEELIIHYLQNQATSRPCPVPIIPEIDIYKFDPWELPGESDARDGEWYFFSLRNRKYPNGTRPNRATKSGYWKATGNDKSIHSRSRFVGTKKALVFYTGRPPRGSKTGWVMHEYRLPAAIDHNHLPSDSMRLVDWVLCRIYIKGKKKSTNTSTSTTTASSTTANTEQEIASIAHLLEYSHECISVSELFEDSPFYSIDDLFQICTTDSSSSTTGDSNAYFYSADAMVPMENHIFQH